MIEVAEYTGSPKEPNRNGESSRWHKFWAKCLPWLAKKLERTDKFADAKLDEVEIQNDIRRAELDKLKEETSLLAMQKEKTRLEAIEKRLEVEAQIQKYQKSKTIDVNSEIIEEVKQRLGENIQKLRMDGGNILRINFKNKEETANPKN